MKWYLAIQSSDNHREVPSLSESLPEINKMPEMKENKKTKIGQQDICQNNELI